MTIPTPPYDLTNLLLGLAWLGELYQFAFGRIQKGRCGGVALHKKPFLDLVCLNAIWY
jgi:hypothetical protein